MKKIIHKNIDSYISGFPVSSQKLLKQLRAAIKKAAPGAEEIISYNMPAYKFHGMLAYFAGHQNHIGLYPMASGIRAFKKELSVYQGSIGTVQFPLDKPIPVALIGRRIKFRVKENLEKMELKKLKSKKKSNT